MEERRGTSSKIVTRSSSNIYLRQRNENAIPPFMKSDLYYSIVEHNVAHEIIDGEVIVIHFDSGNYYSLEGVSVRFWQWLALRPTREQILSAFQELDSRQIQHLDEFVEFLVTEGLLTKTAADPGHQSTSPLPDHEVIFESPKFTKYTDMQVLLMSDPLHDVDEAAGWPKLEGDKV
jgi:hypothetical protein